MRRFDPLYKLIWMVVRHWFWKIDEEYEQKKRFSMCEGCKVDWREYWHPTPFPCKEAADD